MRRPRLRSLIPGARNTASVQQNQAKQSQDAGMMMKLRQLLIGMTQMGAQSAEDRNVRNLILSAAHLARSPGKIKAAIESMNEISGMQVDEASTWLTHDDVADGKSGRFDACDLRNWLVIAEKAGVAAIPAREIASFSASEYAALVGDYQLPHNNPRIERAFKALHKGIEADYSAEEIDAARASAEASENALTDIEILLDRLHSAMDDVPEGWMVRSSVCGGENLKALAGCGVTETFIPEVKFGSNLEVGPGWVRVGNRRRIDIQDKRTMQLYIRNDTVDIAFLARPWVVASRWIEGRDPHRAGTPIDIPGAWPAEWRAFVRAGKVVGVSSYYPWAGQMDAVSARMALKVRDLAQRIVDTAIDQDLTPRSMDDVLMRQQSPRHGKALEAMGFMDGDFDATIDFIEAEGYGAENGLLMLEAGPGCGPFGSGHPCGFAGDYCSIYEDLNDGHGKQELRWMPCEGVAFRNMDHVLIAEPKSWSTGKKAGHIADWDEVERIADTGSAKLPVEKVLLIK